MKYLQNLLLLTLVVLMLGCSKTEVESEKKMSRVDRNRARAEYFANKLKDPETGIIPENARIAELAFSSRLRAEYQASRTSGVAAIDYDWNEVGPADIGGRTRALVQDFRDPDMMIAGGVSGGIWKTTDGGQTWDAKLPEGSNLSISSIAQDTISGNVWYATSGEIADGGSASGKFGGTNFYLGIGIYKSTDNGDTWELATYEQESAQTYVKQSSPDTRSSSLLRNPFNLTSKVFVANFSGPAVFVTTQYNGIWVSTDGGDSFFQFGAGLISNEDPTYSDIIVDKNGVITIWFGPTNSGNNGFYRSYNAGDTYYNVTPSGYPSVASSARTVLAESRNNPEDVYAYVYDGTSWDGASHLFAFDFSNLNADGGTFGADDRSGNLPSFSRSIFGGTEDFTTQGGYDMTVAVHPNNPDIVVLGYVNLIKSEDGFTSSPTNDPARYWIGGNENPWRLDEDLGFDNTHHADQHFAFFDHFDPDVVYAAHDGGISKTADITANRVVWESLNNDYNITQFYTIAAGIYDGDSYVLGGTQDNGTPLLDLSSFDGSLESSLGDISSGDGAYCYANGSFIYSSAQNGYIVIYDLENDVLSRFVAGFVAREDLSTFFIHPFAVDPNDEGTLFFGTNGNGIIARNDQFDEASSTEGFDISLINASWFDVNINDPVAITALQVTDLNPSHKLYFGGSLNGSPVLYEWTDANTSGTSNISGRFLSELPDGIWLNDIAVNPRDGDELILVYSNYNIDGLFYSSDGGTSFTSIEGNLGDNDELRSSGITGPSLRAAEIADDGAGNKKYVVATSIGLFSTESLNGSATQWTIETSLLDNVVIEDLDYRRADGAIAVGTHGRGAYLGTISGTNSNPTIADQTFSVDENSAEGTVIGTVTASDVDGDALTFSIASGDADGYFALTTDGELSVADVTGFDFEAAASFSLGIAVQDGAGGSAEATVTVSVNDVNEAPLIEDQSFALDENSANGTAIGSVVADDPEGNDLNYTLTGGDANTFSLSSEGALSVNDNTSLDFETNPTFSLTVSVSDGAFTSEATMTINLNDVNEGPLSVVDEQIIPYPNPVIDRVYFEGYLEPITYELSDLSGKILLQGRIESRADYLEVKDLEAGLYLLEVDTRIHRIVKN